MEPSITHLLARIVLWLVAEIFLNLIGLDDLADCGEWVFERRIDSLHRSHQSVVTLQEHIDAAIPVFFRAGRQ